MKPKLTNCIYVEYPHGSSGATIKSFTEILTLRNSSFKVLLNSSSLMVDLLVRTVYLRGLFRGHPKW